MNRARDNTILALVACMASFGPTAAHAEDPKATTLTIRPARAPVPALKYRVLPERRELVPGNAAVFYHRALLLNLQARVNESSLPKPTSGVPRTDEKISAWIVGPLKEIPRDEATKLLQARQQVLNEIELAASRLTCDWEFDLRKEGITLQLPEIQDLRSLARLVALKARVELLEGKPEQAIRWFTIGMTMGRHAAQGPTLIQGLVGLAIVQVMTKGFEESIQFPGSPNLYWALATRPRPFIDIAPAIAGERWLLERELPDLLEIDGLPWSVDRARTFGDELFRKLRSFVNDIQMIAPTGTGLGAGPPRLEDLPSRLAMAAMVARVYPEAKRSLIAEGRTAAEVEAMPTIQVVMIHTYRLYRRLSDDVFKWAAFPYWQSQGRADAAWQGQFVAAKLANPLLAMCAVMISASNSAVLAGARLDRQLDALQCVEAIRMYAAEHDGKFPESLDAMTETPVPIDPVTGRSFEYKKVDDTTAILSAPYPPGGPKIPQYMIRYELKLVK